MLNFTTTKTAATLTSTTTTTNNKWSPKVSRSLLSLMIIALGFGAIIEQTIAGHHHDFLSRFKHHNGPQDDKTGSDMIGMATAQILKLRHFGSEVFNVTVNVDCNLNLVRIVNPLLNKVNGTDRKNFKESILFIHGIATSANYFLLNSINARPKDWTGIDVNSMNDTQLIAMLKDEPVAKALPLLLSNFGYDVWMLNRRPTFESQAANDKPPSAILMNKKDRMADKIFGKITGLGAEIGDQLLKPRQSYLKAVRSKLHLGHHDETESMITGGLVYNSKTLSKANIRHKTINPGYWHFSLDEQAIFDLPIVIDFILAKTNRPKVNIVGYSLGAALPLMTMSVNPVYQERIGFTVLFAPAIHLGYTERMSKTLARRIEPTVSMYKGPVIPNLLAPLLQTTAAAVCKPKLNQKLVCNGALDLFLGDGASQIPVIPVFYYTALVPISTHEFVQLLQSVEKKRLHFYDYRNVEQNMLVYNQTEAPHYDMTKIKKANLALYVGNNDALVTPKTVELLVDDLKNVQYDLTILSGAGEKWNHIGYTYHKSIVEKINVPVLKSFEKQHLLAPTGYLTSTPKSSR